MVFDHSSVLGIVDILTVGQLAKLLQVSTKTVERACLRGEIPAFKVGRLWRFDRAIISSWIQESSRGSIDRPDAAGVASSPLTGLQSNLSNEVTHAG